MIEPPEPRRPEDDGGEDDIDEELEEEELAVLGDDVVLDVLGSGENLEGNDLTDMLGAWRDDVDSVPPSPGTAPEIIQEIHDFTQEIDRATTPPRSTSEGRSMSISEEVAELRHIGESQAAVQAIAGGSISFSDAITIQIRDNDAVQQLQHAAEQLAENRMRAVGLLGAGEGAQAVDGAGQNAQASLESAIAAVSAAIAKVDEALAAVQSAQAGISTVRDNAANFYETVKSAASQHGG